MQDGQAVYFNVHKQYLDPDHVARHAADYDDEKKEWYWDKCDTLHKEQHTIMKSLADYGYSGLDNCTKVCHFLKRVQRTELEAMVSVVHAQPEKYNMDFDATVSCLCKKNNKEGLSNAICPYC